MSYPFGHRPQHLQKRWHNGSQLLGLGPGKTRTPVLQSAGVSFIHFLIHLIVYALQHDDSDMLGQHDFETHTEVPKQRFSFDTTSLSTPHDQPSFHTRLGCNSAVAAATAASNAVNTRRGDGLPGSRGLPLPLSVPAGACTAAIVAAGDAPGS